MIVSRLFSDVKAADYLVILVLGEEVNQPLKSFGVDIGGVYSYCFFEEGNGKRKPRCRSVLAVLS